MRILNNLLEKEGITNFEVKGRSKSPYRVYEKLENKYEGKEIGDIMDLLAFRVITKDIGDCYMALGIVHKHYTPVIKKIKDYIAVPKINGYKSIHTTIL
jgi:GTP pyrophosphokinase